jgi:hypothetical protein
MRQGNKSRTSSVPESRSRRLHSARDQSKNAERRGRPESSSRHSDRERCFGCVDRACRCSGGRGGAATCSFSFRRYPTIALRAEQRKLLEQLERVETKDLEDKKLSDKVRDIFG